ncbi:Sodium-dependent phosphate transport protein 2A [Orchesella cincta]|uniref:Sodium-dependent phosphate transport protein 2A n=1 Tax=Orchesella cincta TaxID=48709 RepID=A0A1D2MYW3_ORCCI|nr:Sodium-dependent phosphate transport protein 2A [Orchesella cincta]
MGIGAIMTVLVQSSSVFTSAMTPLIAMGMISLERAYPLTLGSNLGTTTTAMLAALAAEGPNLKLSIQLALCHFLFNLTGILLFYPIPCTRFPIQMAAALGRVTAKYRWFAVCYLVSMFCILPLTVFSLSMLGPTAFYVVSIPIGISILLVILLNLLQNCKPHALPDQLRTWNFLPIWLRSLEPYDRIVNQVVQFFARTCCASCCKTAAPQQYQLQTVLVELGLSL